jgi:hypothetical protein
MRIVSSPRHRLWTYLGSVVSNTTEDKAYEIRRNPVDGTVGCACPGWIIRGRCRHRKAWDLGTAILLNAKPATTPLKVASAGAPLNVTESTVRVGAETFTVRRAISFGTVNPNLL